MQLPCSLIDLCLPPSSWEHGIAKRVRLQLIDLTDYHIFRALFFQRPRPRADQRSTPPPHRMEIEGIST